MFSRPELCACALMFACSVAAAQDEYVDGEAARDSLDTPEPSLRRPEAPPSSRSDEKLVMQPMPDFTEAPAAPAAGRSTDALSGITLPDSSRRDAGAPREPEIAIRRGGGDPGISADPGIPDADAAAGITNDDIVDMVRAEFSDATIAAVIRANPTRFDVSVGALVALKVAGVSEDVIEAMLAAESAEPDPAVEQRAAQAGQATEAAFPVAEMSPEALALLSQMVVDRLGAQPDAATPQAADTRIPEPAPPAEPGPQAWVTVGTDKVGLVPTEAQVAYTDTKITGRTAFKTLQGLAGKALAFANPALGIASDMVGLFRPGDPTVTAVWALRGQSASRAFMPGTVFEIEYGGIPGVDPDKYEPVMVRLVPTSDNYRLVGAAKTKLGDEGEPLGPIIEETVAAESKRTARGRYRIALSDSAPPGEYALVVRPTASKQKRRKRDAGLGELIGGGADDLLYLTWDFTLRN